MEKQPNKKSLKDFQNSKLSAKQQHTAKGGWNLMRPFSESTQIYQPSINEEDLKQMSMSLGMTNFCCGNDNGVW